MEELLNERHRRRLDDNGFTILEGVFSKAEMDAVAESIEGFRARHEAELLAKGGAEGISRAGEITFTDHLAEKNPELLAFCRHPKLVEITNALLGTDVDLYWNQSVFKMPEGEKQFPWHQDDGYTPVEPSPYLTCWVALNDATVENGCIWVRPGSHKGGLAPHEQTDLGLACHSLDDPDQGIPAPISAGSIVVFWSLTMHKSTANRSQEIRKAYIVQYSAEGLKYAQSGQLVPDLLPIARGGQPVVS
jgi:phytanoyl-CoA hydroxylase